MSPDEAISIAREAVKRLVQERGAQETFPLDRIHEYASRAIPSRQRPALAKKLEKEGFLERTGRQVSASTEARAGSLTSEFRPGRHFYSRAPERRGTASELQEMAYHLENLAYLTTPAQLANFYLALLVSPLVILAGPSGTGKSKLPRHFAQLTGSKFDLIPVQPQWSDNTDLLGYTPTLAQDKFIEGRILAPIRQAIESPGTPHIVLLDEMNLAPVEHYFSDVLSIIETRRRSDLGTQTDRLPLPLPPRRADSDPFHNLRELTIPHNLILVGTANMDETTREFSKKVLDRAFTIELDEIDLAAFPTPENKPIRTFTEIARQLVKPNRPVGISDIPSTDLPFIAQIGSYLQEIQGVLKQAGISIGYRTRDAICLYMWYWSTEKLDPLMPFSTAFDFCLFQKILPRINGTGVALQRALDRLLGWLEADLSNREVTSLKGEALQLTPCPRTAARIGELLQQLDDEGVANYWR